MLLEHFKMFKQITQLLAENPDMGNQIKIAVAALKPDMSVMHNYTKADTKIWRPTAVTHFSNGTQNLYYINAEHTPDPNSPTFKTIEKAFEKPNFKAVVIESIDGAKNTIGESGLASRLALEKGIPVIGAEPDENNVWNTFKENGYSEKDMMGYYLLRVMPDKMKGGNLVEDSNKYLQSHPSLEVIRANTPPEKQLKNFDEFKVWYDEHSDGKDFRQIKSIDVAPFADGHYFQKISSVLAKPRESEVDNKIAETINKYGDVLVVYGGSHLTESAPVFAKMFGREGVTEVIVPQKNTMENFPQTTTQPNGRGGFKR